MSSMSCGSKRSGNDVSGKDAADAEEEDFYSVDKTKVVAATTTSSVTPSKVHPVVHQPHSVSHILNQDPAFISEHTSSDELKARKEHLGVHSGDKVGVGAVSVKLHISDDSKSTKEEQLGHIEAINGGRCFSDCYNSDGGDQPRYYTKFVGDVCQPLTNATDIKRIVVPFSFPVSGATTATLCAMKAGGSTKGNLADSVYMYFDNEILKKVLPGVGGLNDESRYHVSPLAIRILASTNDSGIQWNACLEVPGIDPAFNHKSVKDGYYTPISQGHGPVGYSSDEHLCNVIPYGRKLECSEKEMWRLIAIDRDIREIQSSGDAFRWKMIDRNQVLLDIEKVKSKEEKFREAGVLEFHSIVDNPYEPKDLATYIANNHHITLMEVYKRMNAVEVAAGRTPLICSTRVDKISETEQITYVKISEKVFIEAVDVLIGMFNFNLTNFSLAAPWRLRLTPLEGKSGWENLAYSASGSKVNLSVFIELIYTAYNGAERTTVEERKLRIDPLCVSAEAYKNDFRSTHSANMVYSAPKHYPTHTHQTKVLGADGVMRIQRTHKTEPVARVFLDDKPAEDVGSVVNIDDEPSDDDDSITFHYKDNTLSVAGKPSKKKKKKQLWERLNTTRSR